MARTNKTWFAILGLLHWRPMTGYDIKQYVGAALSHFWSESYGQLFPTLKHLVDEGLATRREETSRGKRKRFRYHITSQGRRQFRAWLQQPAAPVAVRNEALLKFFLAAKRSVSDSVALVDAYRLQQSDLHEAFTQSEVILRAALDRNDVPEALEELLTPTAGQAPDTAADRRRQLEVFLLTLRHGVLLCEARLAWCDEALTILKR